MQNWKIPRRGSIKLIARGSSCTNQKRLSITGGREVRKKSSRDASRDLRKFKPFEEWPAEQSRETYVIFIHPRTCKSVSIRIIDRFLFRWFISHHFHPFCAFRETKAHSISKIKIGYFYRDNREGFFTSDESNRVIEYLW